jgi:hypothetical protein
MRIPWWKLPFIGTRIIERGLTRVREAAHEVAAAESRTGRSFELVMFSRLEGTQSVVFTATGRPTRWAVVPVMASTAKMIAKMLDQTGL